MTSNSNEKPGQSFSAQAAGDPEAKDEYSGRSGGGDSGGGAYPNPHQGKKPKGGFLGHGGQTEMAYHGKGQLGDQAVEGNENAPAGKAGADSK